MKIRLFALLVACLISISSSGMAQSLDETRAKAEKGDAAAQYELGAMYATGTGVTQDAVVAAHWLRKAAEQGDVDAQYQLAICYAQGRGNSQNHVEACKWVSLAAAQGEALAKSRLLKAEN